MSAIINDKQSVRAAGKHSVALLLRKLKINNTHDIVSTARQGVKTNTFYDFARRIKMPEKNLAGIINLSARTISNYQDLGRPLDPVNSEHLLKLIALYEKGERIFGHIDEFNYWLNKPFWNLEEKPLDWIVTPGGVDLLMEELDRLAEGYPV